MSDVARDDIIEEVARAIEEPCFLDLVGAMAKRKRTREDADLRRRAREEQRAELARFVRAMKSGSHRFDALTVLADIAADIAAGRRAELSLTSAWPLAWKGWLHIWVRIRANSNSIPPEVEYQIELTDRGRAALESAAQANAQGG